MAKKSERDKSFMGNIKNEVMMEECIESLLKVKENVFKKNLM